MAFPSIVHFHIIEAAMACRLAKLELAFEIAHSYDTEYQEEQKGDDSYISDLRNSLKKSFDCEL
jgi:hypothetical protein